VQNVEQGDFVFVPKVLQTSTEQLRIDHGDGTVTDTETGLMWKRCSEGQSGVNCEEGKAEKFTWDEAVKRFKNVEYAGYSDWRLPIIDELKTLLYCSEGKDNELHWCRVHSQKVGKKPSCC
jgi:hypothetical protein